jgi:hypothetical protein
MKKNGYGQYLLAILAEQKELELRKRYAEAIELAVKDLAEIEAEELNAAEIQKSEKQHAAN